MQTAIDILVGKTVVRADYDPLEHTIHFKTSDDKVYYFSSTPGKYPDEPYTLDWGEVDLEDPDNHDIASRFGIAVPMTVSRLRTILSKHKGSDIVYLCSIIRDYQDRPETVLEILTPGMIEHDNNVREDEDFEGLLICSPKKIVKS